jgi:hypothetical protein
MCPHCHARTTPRGTRGHTDTLDGIIVRMFGTDWHGLTLDLASIGRNCVRVFEDSCSCDSRSGLSVPLGGMRMGCQQVRTRYPRVGEGCQCMSAPARVTGGHWVSASGDAWCLARAWRVVPRHVRMLLGEVTSACIHSSTLCR